MFHGGDGLSNMFRGGLAHSNLCLRCVATVYNSHNYDSAVAYISVSFTCRIRAVATYISRMSMTHTRYSRGAQLISQIVPEIFLEGKWGPQWGSGAVPPPSSGQGVRWTKSPEADDDLLIQRQKFCAHSYVYAEIQL